jgi:hypothetical protein
MIDVPALEIKEYKHIKYTEKDGTLHRVCHPFGDEMTFLVPIRSLEEEYNNDLRIAKEKQQVLYPDIKLDEDQYREIYLSKNHGPSPEELS